MKRIVKKCKIKMASKKTEDTMVLDSDPQFRVAVGSKWKLSEGVVVECVPRKGSLEDDSAPNFLSVEVVFQPCWDQ